MIDSDGFQVVKRKHRVRQAKNLRTRSLSGHQEENIDVSKCRKQISQCLKVLEQSVFFDSFQKEFSHACVCKGAQCERRAITDDDGCTRFEEMVVYGIGSLAGSVISRYQFALALLLARKYRFRSFLFDPVLSDPEKALVEEYGVEIITQNEECKRQVSGATAFVMMHCGKAMYNNLLWSNWKCLRNICIIGNAFSSYLERVPSRELEKSASYIKKIIPFTREHTVDNSFMHDDIFNDTAIHTFPEGLLCTADQTMWQNMNEPVRNDDDTEIITNES